MTDKLKVLAVEPVTIAERCTISRLFFTWLRIGFTSFGGGAVTQYLIQEYIIYKRKWITAEEYVQLLAMCQITPGMNIIAVTILIGKRLGGAMGIFVSLMGLILPSAGITIGLAAIYTNVSEFPRAQAALRSVFAAIFGIALVTNWRNIRPILAGNYKRGRGALLTVLGIMFGSAVIYVLFAPPVVVLYFVGGGCGALAYWHRARKARED